MKPDINQEKFIKTKRQRFMVPVWGLGWQYRLYFRIFFSNFLNLSLSFPPLPPPPPTSPVLSRSFYSVSQLLDYFTSLFISSLCSNAFHLSSAISQFPSPILPLTVLILLHHSPFPSSCFQSLFDSIYARRIFSCRHSVSLQAVCTSAYSLADSTLGG